MELYDAGKSDDAARNWGSRDTHGTMASRGCYGTETDNQFCLTSGFMMVSLPLEAAATICCSMEFVILAERS